MFGFFSKKKKPVKITAKKKGASAKSAAKAAASPPDAAKPDSLKQAIAALETEAPVSAGAPLDRAKDALEKRAGAPADRQKLIQQALAIQQAQSKLLDKLPDETRKKLRDLAVKTFVLDPRTDKKKLH